MNLLEKRRGFFSNDVLVAVILVTMIFVVALYAFKTNLGALSSESRMLEKERNALSAADALVKELVAEKDGAFVKSHEIDLGKIAQARERFGKAVKSIRVNPETGGGGICVRRIALASGKEIFIEVCA